MTSDSLAQTDEGDYNVRRIVSTPYGGPKMVMAMLSLMTSPTPTQISLYPLWQRLNEELSSTFDAHGVCAAIATEVAQFSGTTTVVGISNPLMTYFDVWIARPNGRLEQIRWENKKSSFPGMLAYNAAASLTKLSQPASEVIQSELWRLAHDSILFLPLPLDHHAYTAPTLLCLVDATPLCPITLENIQDLGRHVTVYLDRAALRHRSDRQEIEFATIYDITYSLTSTLDLNSIIAQLADPVRRSLDVESLSIGMIEPASGDILFVSQLMGPLFQSLPPIRLKPGQGIGGWVAQNAEPVIVNNVYTDTRFFSQSDRDSGFHTHSILCVPLVVETRVIGIVEAINKLHGNFTDHDLRLLRMVSAPLAVAIENARLHANVLAEERRVKAIFESMAEGMLTVNADGRITAANDSLLTLLHKEMNQIVGKQADQVIHVDNRQGFATLMEQVLQAEDDYPQLVCNVTLSGNGRSQVPVLISGAPILNDDDKVYEMIFVFSDLSQIREVERMRDDFFHGVVHELRTPLATILMYARLLREGRAKDDQAKADRFLGVIERESDRLQMMVRQMLQLAKLEASQIQRSAEPVNLNRLFDQLLPPMADQATEKGLTFIQRVQADLPPIHGVEETLYLIFKNLVENAIKFTLNGTVRIEGQVDGQMIQVRVKDAGIGIPKEAVPNLFRRFYRAQSAVERGIAGTGLGLHMVKEGVEKHGGTIEVQSAEGEGTTFTVRLPIAVR